MGLPGGGFSDTANQTRLELIARHHGVPTTILDWTRSPYVGAFFAFGRLSTETEPTPEKVAIWCLDLSLFDDQDGGRARTIAESLEVFDDPVVLDSNPRAIEQQSVFLRMPSAELSLEELAGDRLRKFELPASERDFVLGCLDEMRISHRSLFRDLDAAARTARWRVSTMARSL